MMHTIPKKQGLYDPQHERDACGIGFIAHMKGVASFSIIEHALTILRNLDHRGGQGAETNTGDGAGILIQIPHAYFQEVCTHFVLPHAGDYGVGMTFLPQDETLHDACVAVIERIVTEEGYPLLGWRDVPVDLSGLGEGAIATAPRVRQLFIGRVHTAFTEKEAFERKLYVIRKRIEHTCARMQLSCYIPSLSSRTIVYKGMLTPDQVSTYYTELRHPLMASALALVHSRFSTNTFPSWERAHPYRYTIHNGEINTLRGNVNWMKAREALFQSEAFHEDLKKVLPIIDESGSDSQIFDQCLEFLLLSGRSLPHVAMMMIPEPWAKHETMDDDKKAFYEYHSCLMEPWDGPAAMAFTDGSTIAAVLDRNGLRPARYCVTEDDLVILASEAGVLDIDPARIVRKDRLRPGRMLLVDTVQGRILPDEEIKHAIANAHPYRQWLDAHMIDLDALPSAPIHWDIELDALRTRQHAFGYTFETLQKILKPMALTGVDPIGSMGYDAPLAVLSERPQLLYSYFKQLFAQVTNPPIDANFEELVTSQMTTIGSETNLLHPTPQSCQHIRLKTPLLSNEDMSRIRHNQHPAFRVAEIPIVFASESGDAGLEEGLRAVFHAIDDEIQAGTTVLILSDRGLTSTFAPIPALLAIAGAHHHLIRTGKRTTVSLIVESGEPREVHHFALLLGYGANAINPYLALDTIEHMRATEHWEDAHNVSKQYISAATKGVVKVLAKMGISTIQSYRGAQIFEAVGIHQDVIDAYFTWTTSRIGGIGLQTIAAESLARHRKAFPQEEGTHAPLDTGGELQWRKEGEEHVYQPETIHALQTAVRTGNKDMYRKFAALIHREHEKQFHLRGLLTFRSDRTPVPLEEVESVEDIVRRFKTGAMSYGSISQEAHETLAIAMNRLGGKSNTGEGGEHPSRFVPDASGHSRRSAIKQVASGRFGVTSHYLVNADEIQIKMAQGAKPGEGGQLPGGKVYPWIAEVRGVTPGVGLISPPPHHDIYSIEDLAELIHDLKNANPNARISVKLVSEVGVGTIAAGVAKGKADVVLISGYDGGTGASPQTSIRHAGLPWELGLAETHQTLVLNNLRSRIVVEADGKLMTGRDVILAALLGAEEFGFATTPLIAIGCVMMRVCHLDTCPVGVATQNPELREKFTGDPQHVIHLMQFIAEDVREWMAKLGFRTIEEMIGRTDVLEPRNAIAHWKAKHIDLTALLHRPSVDASVQTHCVETQNHRLDESLDRTQLLDMCRPALEHRAHVHAILPIRNTHRVVGTILGSEVTRRCGAEGLPHDTIRLHFHGSAGQSFGAFVPKGVTLSLEGDANDYVGKGLSGGKLIVFPPTNASFVPEHNVLIGNVALYGATGGELYVRGIAGERFCVRNSGAHAVVEGVGDHGCEYMTGGRVVVLGAIGRNFAAGMSGGIAYVYDADGTARTHVNAQMVLFESLDAPYELNEVRALLRSHVKFTGSTVAHRILDNWEEEQFRFLKIIPKDFKRMFDAIEQGKRAGLSTEQAVLVAFEHNMRDKARIGGN
ncbi:MAG: glutamate synthase large subunit [Paenibacillaceae bacterium]|nr:glutamate synthase large subunit [Paenibacillaceae bacterium]